MSQYTWVYCDQGQGSWARWAGAGQALGSRRAKKAGVRGARRRACMGARARGATGARACRAEGVAERGRRAAWVLGARAGLGCVLGLFSIRFDSVLFLSRFLDVVCEPGS